MSEDGYKVQVTISLPPSAQYAKGDMMNVRAADADDLLAALTGLFDADAARAIITKFRSYAVTVPEAMTVEQVTAALTAPPKPAAAAAPKTWATTAPTSAPRQSGGGGKAVTEKQLGLIRRIITEKGLSIDNVLDLAATTTRAGFRPAELERLSSFEASKLIDLLRDSAGNVA